MSFFKEVKTTIIDSIKNKLNNKPKMPTDSVVEDSPLSTEIITFSFCGINYLIEDDFLSLVSDELKVPKSKVSKGITRIISDMRKDIVCCIEYPYIDIYYRDTYYAFYSKKHNNYSRYCFRISFFSNDVNEQNFYNQDLSNKFYGYMVLRPTVRRVIGYTFFSPTLFNERSFVCCLCKKDVSIYGRKLSVTGFPFCGQDGEAISCAEISLIMMMDYFSYKYNKYRQLLPSQIVKILSKYSNERQLPSRGLPLDMISFVLKKIGFGIRTYTRMQEDADCEVYNNDEFKKLLYVYIESGFPIIACTNDHTFLIIGKENKISEGDIKLVTIDDNKRPYKLIDYDESITSFIVPLYEKIYLDAEMLQIDKVIESLETSIPDLKIKTENTTYIYRCFLTTSRSYKDYITISNTKKSRELFVCMAMPRFIWVCEMIDIKELENKDPKKIPVSNIMLFDATEGNASLNYFIMAKFPDRIIVRTVDNSQYHRKIYKQFMNNKDIFYTFDHNLKGEHTKWQD